jgi:hypothetical protein
MSDNLDCVDIKGKGITDTDEIFEQLKMYSDTLVEVNINIYID